jgi:UDP-3-O-[3-hydroxymyristoyl] glucosamine N-acyltransferase
MMRTLGELATLCGAELRGDAGLEIRGVATLANATSEQVAFLANPKYQSQLAGTRAAAVILDPVMAADWSGAALVSQNPYLAYARVAGAFERREPIPPGVHATACVASDARIAGSARIGPGVVIGSGTEIGDNVEIGANCVIAEKCLIGATTRLAANVTLYDHVVIGSRCLLHSGVVVGADGFGHAPVEPVEPVGPVGESSWEKVPQLGAVRIGDDVEIGANTTIDRGALDDTIIETGVRLDNLIQVAHNVHIGAHTAIAGTTAIAGSTRIGSHCMIAGGVGIAGHLEIASGVTILARTLVTHSIREKGVYAGSHPMEEVHAWRKNNARLRRLDELARRVAALEKQVMNRGKADK